jgi:hypothetical protein
LIWRYRRPHQRKERLTHVRRQEDLSTWPFIDKLLEDKEDARPNERFEVVALSSIKNNFCLRYLANADTGIGKYQGGSYQSLPNSVTNMY